MEHAQVCHRFKKLLMVIKLRLVNKVNLVFLMKLSLLAMNLGPEPDHVGVVLASADSAYW